MKKRLLAAIMSLCMIVSLLPVSAFAAPGEDMEDRSGGSQNAYFYVVKPEKANDTSRNQENFIYMGQGQIIGAESAADDGYYGGEIDKDNPEWKQWSHVPPDELENITYQGEDYEYWDENGPKPTTSYYTIEWFRYTSASGANGAGVTGMCWHVDGFVTLNDKVNVQFQVQFPEESDFTIVGSDGKPGQPDTYWYVDKDSTFGAITNKPQMEDRTEGGTTYEFEGCWYTDDNFKNKVTADTPITEDTIFYGRYVKKGPDLTVTKELTKVVRDRAELTGALSNDTTLYAGDVVTWEITVTNGTDTPKSYSLSDDIEYVSSENQSFPAEGTILWSDDSSESSFNKDEFTVQAGQAKTITAQYTIEDYYGGYTLTNTATVKEKFGTAEAEDSTSNPIGHILTVTYNGNGGTIDGVENGDKTVRKTVYAPTVPYTYKVETENLGFQNEGYTFDDWYKDEACTQPAGTDPLHSTATYYAGWTKDEEPVDPETDIFFFISLPSNDEAMSGSENDYRYLTHGGVIDKALADAAQIDATGITSLDDETEITKFVETWPAGKNISLGNTEDVEFNIASPSVGTGSSWTIDENGNVTEFSITITDKNGQTKPYTSDDYGIRWAKISYATTAVVGSDNIEASTRYHVDGVLYKKATVDDVLTKGNFQKTVSSDTLSYDEQGTANTSEGFSFVLDMLTGENGQPSNAFDDIELTATVTSVGTPATITLPADSTAGSTPLTPGYYVIQEKLEGDQANAWKDPDPIYFELTSNGNVVVADEDINNTLKTYTLTYNANEGTGGPAAQSGLKYNQSVEIDSTTIPTRENYTFLGWATTADATVSDVISSTSIQIKDNTTLYAVWQTNTAPTMYTVTFNPNNRGTTQSWTLAVEQGQAVSEPADPTWNDDYIFMGWTTEPISGETYGVGENLPEMVFQNGASFTPTSNTTLYAVWSQDTDGDKVPDVNEVFIAPANITIYTGGTGYSGVTDEDGNVIDEYEGSGLPEPGFHIVLPADLGIREGSNLENVLTFHYSGEDTLTGTTVDHTWTLSYVGVYSMNPTRYVYSLSANSNGVPIRILYKDGAGNVQENDQIDMSANAASAEYTMSINPGGLEQGDIEAVITKTDGSTDNYNLVIGTGNLTIRSTVTDNTNTIVDSANEVSDGSFNAVGNNASYVVNDSEVPVSTADDRVQLLVDQVSNSPDFNNAMGEAALDHPQVNGTAFETVYLDLVDTQNGNTVVTLANGSMDIYWPMPSDADPSGTFQVVHYYNMNRETTVDDTALDTQASEVLTGTPVYRNGDWYVRFTTHSFSPFVLVYEEDTSRPVNPNPGGGSGSGDNNSDPTGNLSIELDVNGGDDEFTFTVILTDKDGDDLENNFYYNGDYTGTIGSGDEITLEGGDKIVIRNLPEGTRYEVIIETADGYTYVIDGEEGVIHTGMNEAEFTATRTVPVADPSVTGVSRWLNTTDHIAYLTGYPGGAFGPDNNMTRAEVAQMFYALLNNKNVTITKTFPDVPADAWYATAVNTLASLGMVSGDENGNYRPNDPITRAEFCVIALAFAYEPENAVCYFGDVSRSDWFYTYVAQAASYGWIGGYTNGNFGPNDRITRAQVTTIVNNMLGRAADRDYVIDHQADLVQFTDLTRAHWGYFQIMEATNAHDYTKSNGTENWR